MSKEYLLLIGVLLAIIIGMGYHLFVGNPTNSYFDPTEDLPIYEEVFDYETE